MTSLSHWVTTSSRDVRYSGTISRTGRGAITTPAACTPQCLARPSSRRPTSMRRPTSGLPATASARRGESRSASSRVTPIPSGTNFAIRSVSANDIPITRPTSRMQERACRRLNVAIWETFSLP